ncbi:MAG: L,D-transpeptidase family protein [Nitrospinales bacterium]
MFYIFGRGIWVPVYQKFSGKLTVADAIKNYGEDATLRLASYFIPAGIPYPPPNLTFLAMKEEMRLEIWTDLDGKKVFIRSYPILKTSGVAGPKLIEGDGQVPEGIYKIEGLNPNSSFHLSLKLNYPNAFDLSHANAEGRNKPGTNIFIHGKSSSIGCLAMGDETIEEIFTLVEAVGRTKVKVILAPRDPRKHKLQPDSTLPVWVNELYVSITEEYLSYQKMPPISPP